jgi:uncharacterized protein (TIGR02996 family)
VTAVAQLEAALLEAIREAPADPTAWLVLADWLEEYDDPRRGELVRLRMRLRDPRLPEDERAPLERRQAELVVSGVGPCVPTVANALGMEFALIAPGQFWMGSPEKEKHRYADEGPCRVVTLTTPYYLGRHLVTQGQYQRVMDENPSHFTGDERLPVDRVSWDNATEFCRRLSSQAREKRAKRRYRLPTEAEWENACRAGTTTPFFYGRDLTSAVANFDGTRPYGTRRKGVYLEKTTPVGIYPPNAWGLYDVHGNLWEWCQDYFDREFYQNGPAVDPMGPEEGEDRVLRGGSFYYIGASCRSAIRLDRTPESRSNLDGFRVLMEWRA